MPRRRYVWARLAACAAAACLSASADHSAQAGPECGRRADIEIYLDRSKGEKTIVLARAGDVVVEVYASARGETWTLTIVGAGGVACIIRSGTDWESYQPGALNPREG